MKLSIVLLLFSLRLFANDLYITGKVIDNETKTPLPSANVLIYHLPDSTLKGTVTSNNGLFKSDNLRSGNYALVITFLGYKSYSENIVLKDKPLDIGVIALEPQNIKTDEALVIGKLPVAILSGDTTVFNADAFKVNKDAVAEDLLKKVPGIQMESGKLKAQGEEVKKIFVDGKSYMGDDPNVPLKNIPADIIEKIQVFDQQSEQSQFTGFNDGNTTKAINLITRMKVHEASFGKFVGGYGTDKRYAVGSNFNYFNDDQRVSLLGQINNTNEQNFSNIDLLSVMGDASESPGRFRNRGGDFFSTPRNGEVKVKAFGINYNDKYFESLESGSNYFFNNTDNNLLSSLKRNYLNSGNGTVYTENTNSRTKNTNHRFNMSMNYQLDTMNSIRFLPGFSFQKNNLSSNTIGLTNSMNGLLNYTNSSNLSDLSGINFNSLLMFRHKFNINGRTLSLVLNTSYKENKGNRKVLSESLIYNTLTNSSSINQSADILNNGHSIQADLVYTEQINTSIMLLLNGSFSTSKDKNDKETFNYQNSSNSYSIFDTLLSNVYQKSYVTRSAGPGFRYRKNKLVLNANLNYSISTLKSDQDFPNKISIKRDFYSLLPSLMMQYSIARDKSLNLFYRTFNNTPSASQLQNVVDNSNPLQLTTGNPNLKQEYFHSIALRLSTTNFNNMNTFFMMLSGAFKNNHIGTTTILARRDTTLANGIHLNSGTQLSFPENYSGYMSLQSFMTYGLPVDLISSTMNFNFNVNYQKTPGTFNGLLNTANTLNYGLGVVVSSNISTNIDFTISSTSSLNKIRNSSSTINNDDYFSQSTSLKFYWLAFDRLTLQTDLNHRYVQGLTKPTSYLLNINLGYKLFENKKGELRLSVNDLLNQNNNNSKQTTENYTQEYSTNLMGRYFLLTFNYNLSTFN